jgi:hypothetical protein
MTRDITLSPSVRRDLGALARTRLAEALTAITHDPSGPPDAPDYQRLTITPLDQVTPDLSRAAYLALTADPRAGADPRWEDVCRRAPALRQEWRRTNLPLTSSERQQRLVNLAFFTAGVLIPLLAGRGAYRSAVQLAGSAYRLITGSAHRRVLGAGAGGLDGRMRYLLLSPVIWSLAAFHPAAPTERSDDR